MKIAVLSDTHAGIRNSSDIFADNAEKFFDEVFFPYLLKNDIKHILHLGDVFDNRKVINIKTINRFRKMFLEPLRKHNIHMDVIPGNHDVFYKNTNDLNSLKEFLGHYMDVVTIFMNPVVHEYGGCKLAVLPWINSENYEQSMSFIQSCKSDILCGHLDIQGFNMMRGVVNTHGMDPSIFDRFESVYTGHFHTKSDKDNIHYLGSQLEFFWSDAHDPKYFHTLDMSTRELEAIRNPHTLFLKIYYDEDKLDDTIPDCDGKFVKIIVENRKNLYDFDKYVEKIQAQKIHDLKIIESYEEFTGVAVEDTNISIENTENLLDSYIDAVDTELDKNLLKIKMRTLLTEAETLEIV